MDCSNAWARGTTIHKLTGHPWLDVDHLGTECRLQLGVALDDLELGLQGISHCFVACLS